MRNIPDKPTAEGMRRGILSQREREGLTGPEPFSALDMDKPGDRAIVASVYAHEPRLRALLAEAL